MNKELRVFVLEEYLFDKFMELSGEEIYADKITEWQNAEELPPEAKIMIEIAEDNGDVYSISGFTSYINWNEVFTGYCLITDQY